MFPPIPSWDALHPLVIHFPIALLLVAPLFVIAAMAMPRRGWAFGIAALVLMLLGTVAAFVAVETGESAAELAERSPAMAAVLERHEHLAEFTRNFFAILTPVYAAILFLPLFLKRIPSLARIFAQAVFLAAYLVAMVYLANTAHQGGLLVHQHGIHAMVAQAT